MAMAMAMAGPRARTLPSALTALLLCLSPALAFRPVRAPGACRWGAASSTSPPPPRAAAAARRNDDSPASSSSSLRASIYDDSDVIDVESVSGDATVDSKPAPEPSEEWFQEVAAAAIDAEIPPTEPPLAAAPATAESRAAAAAAAAEAVAARAGELGELTPEQLFDREDDYFRAEVRDHH